MKAKLMLGLLMALLLAVPAGAETVQVNLAVTGMT